MKIFPFVLLFPQKEVPLQPHRNSAVHDKHNYYMFNTHQRKGEMVTWKHFSHKGYSAFCSMGKQIRIGVLTVAVLGSVARAQAEEVTVASVQQVALEDSTEHELTDVTVSGTMAPLPALQAARIVAVITRQDIEQAGVSSVNDLLKLTSGVDVRQRGGFGVQTDISIAGSTYEQVTILLNGINISNPHTGHLAADFPVSVHDIERIEVLEGAASRVYGGQAFGGAINVVTRKDRQQGIEMGAEGGMHGTMQADARMWMQRGRVGNYLSGGGGRSDGGTLNDAWSKGQLYYQGDYRSHDLDLDWQFGFSRKEYGANTFYSGMSNDQWEQNERYLISVKAETKGRLHLQPSAYWNRTYDNYQWHKGTPNNSHQADVYGARLGAYTNWSMGKTAVSAELRNEGILSSALGTLMDSVDFRWAHGAEKQYTKHANRTNVSFNLEHNILLPHWTISAGVMANMNTMVDSRFRFYPGIDMAYRPNSQWKVYLSYNKGFRLPSFTDLYYNSPDITGNDQLRPELTRALSLGSSYAHKGVSATVRAFYNRGRNMIDYVKTAFGNPARADNFTLDNLGAEARVRLDFPQMTGRNIFVRNLEVGYTYIYQHRDGRYPIFTSLYANDYLRHKLTASLHHRIWDRLSATWSVRWQDRMGNYQVYSGLTPINQLANYHAYTTLDLKLQWTAAKYQVYVQGTNLTDCHYQDIGNIPQPGFWLMAGARVRI